MERILAKNQWFSYRKTNDSGSRNSLHEVKRSENPKRCKYDRLPKRIRNSRRKIKSGIGSTESLPDGGSGPRKYGNVVLDYLFKAEKVTF